ncbi:MAG: YciI family protein [Saprospiraceae bacterium]
MQEFLLVFRRDVVNNEPSLSPEQLQAMMKPWQDWIGNIAAQNKLVDSGNRLAWDGKVLKPGNIVTNGPFVELKEAIGGYTIIKANSIEEATELSLGCPILHVGGSVEVREIIKMDNG